MSDAINFYFTWEGQQMGILVYLIVIFANTLLNAVTLRRLDGYPAPPRWPAVAVLIPVRNEERTIEKCLTSLLVQDYPDYDIWVLDDLSTDNTAVILEKLSARHSRLNVLAGKPLPEGWLGKPWACQQLADATESELLLYVDSDTWHHPAMLRDAVSALEAEKADLLSVIPDEVYETLAEKLTVPVIPWSLFTHFPLALTQKHNWRTLSIAIGQMMLFRRHAYQRIGGHAAVRSEIAEDLALAKQMARAGGRWRLLDGVSRVHCRMYRSWAEAWSGLGKNFFSAFGGIWWLYTFIWIWMGIAFLSPLVFLLLSITGNVTISPMLVVASMALAVAMWGLYTWRLRAPWVLVPLYPAIISTSLVLAAHSLIQQWRGRATWKDRSLG